MRRAGAYLMRPLRSVRVRITLAATAVTALAVFGAAWALIRAVEDTQITNLRAQAESDLDSIEAELARGAAPRVDSRELVLDGPLLLVIDEGFLPIYPEAPIDIYLDDDGVFRAGEVWGIDLGDEVLYGHCYDDWAPDGCYYAEEGDWCDTAWEVDPGVPEEELWLDDDCYGEVWDEDDQLDTRRFEEAECFDELTGDCAVDDEAFWSAEACFDDDPGLEDSCDELWPDEPAPSGPLPDGVRRAEQVEQAEQYSADLDLLPGIYPWDEPMDTAVVVENMGQAGQHEIVARTVETPSGEATLVGAVFTDEVARSLDAVRRPLMIGLPLLVALVGVATWLLVGRALRPVEAIRAEAAGIEGATIHRRVPEPPTGDEVGRLARTMNAMLDRLDRSSQRQRQFVSDASHELRSPVAAIRTDIEVALHEGDQADWQRVGRDVLAEEARLESLLDDLLLLATDDERNGERQSVGAGHDVDLAALVADQAARSRRVPLGVGGPAGGSGDRPVMVRGSARLLHRLVGNLLDNAARHATERAQVTVEDSSGRVRIVVDDDGAGIPEADRAQVFERFVRLDEGRTRDQGGAGLGLAVVAAITQRHGGAVWISDSPLGGARVVVDLPA